MEIGGVLSHQLCDPQVFTGGVIGCSRCEGGEIEDDFMRTTKQSLVDVVYTGIDIQVPPDHSRLQYLQLQCIIVEDEAGIDRVNIQTGSQAAEVHIEQALVDPDLVGMILTLIIFSAIDGQHGSQIFRGNCPGLSLITFNSGGSQNQRFAENFPCRLGLGANIHDRRG